MGRKALEILSVLAEAEDDVVSKGDILDSVWPGVSVEENVIQVHVAAIRKALGAAADKLVTVHGIGYQLCTQETATGDGALPRNSDERPTIAVLKFEDHGGGSGDDWFAEGVAEEILLRVSQITNVRTLASGSSFQLAGEDRAPPSVAEQLGATHVLDGSVRRQDAQIRIIAQLVATATGTVMWSDSFDGDTHDIFAFQEAVAQATAAALESELRAGRSDFDIDPRSYDLYLQGRQLSGIIADAPKAIGYFRQVTGRAPNFGPAWASLAMSLALRARWDVEGPDYHKLADEARKAAKTALSLDDAMPNANIALGMLEPLAAFAERERFLTAARQSGDHDPETTRSLGEFAYSVGRIAEALRWYEDSRHSDPLNPITIEFYASLLLHAGRYDEGMATFRFAQEKWPDIWWFTFDQIMAASHSGDWDTIDSLREDPRLKQQEVAFAWGVAESLRRNDDKARQGALAAAEQQVAALGRVDPSFLIFMSCLGLTDEVYDLVERSDYNYRFQPEGRGVDGVGFHEGIIFAGAGRTLRSDPRFANLCTKLGLSSYWVESDRWPDCADEVEYDFRTTCHESLQAN